MPEFTLLDNGLEVPTSVVRDILGARMRGDHMAAYEHAASLERMIEDLTDRMVSSQMLDGRDNNQTPQARQHMFKSIRRIRRTNPLAKHAAKLVTRYTFGMGITWKAKDADTIAPLIKRWWDDPDNKVEISTHRPMTERCDDLFTDGEIFFALFSGDDGRVKVRHIPPEEIVDVVTHPHDKDKPTYYRRLRYMQHYDYATGQYRNATEPTVSYIPAWNNYNVEQDKLKNQFFLKNPQALDDSMRIYHVAINKQQGKFGQSELFAPRDWLKSFTQFVEDRVTINRAAAAIAWQRKVKGASGKDISEAVARGIAGKEFQFGDQTITLPPVSGSTVTTPENVEYRWTRGDTGAAAAVDDGRTLLMIFGAGVGLPIHWLGEGGDANLATATAMNFPVFRMFLEWQMLWNTVFDFMHQYVIAKAVEANLIPGASFEDTVIERGATGPEIIERTYIMPEDLSTFVDVDFPPLVQEDMKTTLEALEKGFASLSAGNLESKKDYAAAALTALGFDNVDEMIERHFEGVTELPAPMTPGAPVQEMDVGSWVNQGKGFVRQLRQMTEELASPYRNGNGHG